jgi:hypothetical protein
MKKIILTLTPKQAEELAAILAAEASELKLAIENECDVEFRDRLRQSARITHAITEMLEGQ